MLSRKIKNNILSHKIISFDIFDTALVRNFMHPEDLFYYIEWNTGREGYARARLSAEALYYKTRSKEATIDDIYEQIPEFRDLEQIEFEVEEKCIVRNEEIKEIYDYVIAQGKQVLFVSDMYLPKNFIAKLLVQNGYEHYDALYVSNDIQCRKYDGKMYDYVLEQLKVVQKQILHIGDNKYSDYVQAKKKGISAILYKSRKELTFQESEFLKFFYEKNKSKIDVSFITAILSQYKETKNYWQDFGFKVAGPVIYAYAQWLKQQFTEKNINKVLFVGRDGYILKKVFDKLDNIDVVSHYVYAPRGLFYSTNLDFSEGLDERYNILCRKLQIDTGKQSCKEYVLQNIQTIEKEVENTREKANYREYIKRYVADNENVAVVDAGSGNYSSQKLIQKELGKSVIGFYFLTASAKMEWTQQLEHYDFIPSDIRYLYYQKEMDLVELFMHSPEPLIETFKDAKPVFRCNLDDAELFRMGVISSIECGVLRFVEAVHHSIVLPIQPTTVLHLLDSFLKNPTKDDIRNFFYVKQPKDIIRSSYKPMLSAPWHLFSMDENLSLMWRTPWQNFMMKIPFRFLHRGKTWVKFVFLPNAHKKYFIIPLWLDWEICVGKYE